MRYELPRGTKDILPEEVDMWHKIEATCQTLFKRYNYKEIRTPTFEVTGLFEGGVGKDTDIVQKEMYTFMDRGGRSLTLRPEGTAPIVRAFLQNSMHKKNIGPTKVYYAGPMFRYERPQAGRFRQFHQIGVENLGCEDPFADAEIISLGVHIFDNLGLSDLSVTINSVGCPVCRPVIEERIKQFIGSTLSCLCTDCQRRYNENPLRILDCKNTKCQPYFLGLPDICSSHCQSCKDHFNLVLEYLDTLGIVFNVNPRLVRGLDYYTRTTFEIISDQLGAQNAICGGGRYDFLVEKLGGPKTPAVGFAFGVERAVMILKGLPNRRYDEPIEVFLAPLGFAQKTRSFFLLDELRRAGITAEMSYLKDDLKTHLKHANRIGAEYTLIYGESEAETGKGILKNMRTGEQVDILMTDIVKRLKKVLKT